MTCLEWTLFPTGGVTLITLSVVSVYFFYAVANPTDRILLERSGIYWNPKLFKHVIDGRDASRFVKPSLSSLYWQHQDSSFNMFVPSPQNESGGKGKKVSLVKELIVSLLRGGYHDTTNHYQPNSDKSNPPPPPPPPMHRDNEPTNEQQTCVHNFSNTQYCSDTASNKPPYPTGTWERYLRATNNDAQEAQRRLTETLLWRSQYGMDQILSLPHTQFDIIKRYYPHAFHLQGWNNEPVYYESPAKINLEALKQNGLSLENLIRHYALMTEFMWSYVSPHQHGPMSRGITVIDLDGMRMRDFVGDVVTFVKRAASFTSQHYPERAGTIYILNSPPFFQVIWRMIKPLVDPVTLDKVRVVQNNQGHFAIRDALMERIPIQNIPREYGGESQYMLGGAPEEQLLQELMNHNNYHGNKPQNGHVCRFCNQLQEAQI